MRIVSEVSTSLYLTICHSKLSNSTMLPLKTLTPFCPHVSVPATTAVPPAWWWSCRCWGRRPRQALARSSTTRQTGWRPDQPPGSPLKNSSNDLWTTWITWAWWLTAWGERPWPGPVLPAQPALAAGQHIAGVTCVGDLLPGVKQDLSGHQATVGRLPGLATFLAWNIKQLTKYSQNPTIIEVVRMTTIYLWQLVAWGGPGDTMPELRWPTWSEFISGPTSETIKQMMTFPFTERGVFIWCEWGRALAGTNDGNHKMKWMSPPAPHCTVGN